MEEKTMLDNVRSHVRDIDSYRRAIESGTFPGGLSSDVSKLLVYLSTVRTQLRNKEQEIMTSMFDAEQLEAAKNRKAE